MSKYRLRELVEAYQWFPGRKIIGVIEGTDADGNAVALLDTNKSLVSHQKLSAGDWVVMTRDPSDRYAFESLLTEKRLRHRVSDKAFRQCYEDVGG